MSARIRAICSLSAALLLTACDATVPPAPAPTAAPTPAPPASLAPVAVPAGIPTIAFSVELDEERSSLWLVEPDGSALRRAPGSLSGDRVARPFWLADGSRLVAQVDDRLVSLDPASGEEQILAAVPPDPTVSPLLDGRVLLWWGDGLTVVDRASGAARVIVPAAPRDFPLNLRPSADERYLIVEEIVGDEAVRCQVVELPAMTVTMASDQAAACHWQDERHPALLYLGGGDGEGGWYVSEVNGAGRHPAAAEPPMGESDLPTLFEYELSLASPDGRYALPTADEIALAKSDGTTVALRGADLTGASVGALDWSPDGRGLAIADGDAPGLRLLYAELDSGRVGEIVPDLTGALPGADPWGVGAVALQPRIAPSAIPLAAPASAP